MWKSDLGVITGRTMDWPESTQPLLTVTPRGRMRHGGTVGDQLLITDNAHAWRSRYGSLSTSVYGIGTVDGLNERGLGAHALYLTSADYGRRDPSRPGVQNGLWTQYVLDNAASVDEALALMDDVQLVMASAHGHDANIHLAIEDVDGDSAILEFLDGEMVVHHGPQYRVMTNEPPYDQQLDLLAQQDFSEPASDVPVPGNVNPIDRFQRASYFEALLPKPANEREAAASMFSVMRNVSVPFGAPYRATSASTTPNTAPSPMPVRCAITSS
jgi:choloylglycine hydrolase